MRGDEQLVFSCGRMTIYSPSFLYNLQKKMTKWCHNNEKMFISEKTRAQDQG